MTRAQVVQHAIAAQIRALADSRPSVTSSASERAAWLERRAAVFEAMAAADPSLSAEAAQHVAVARAAAADQCRQEVSEPAREEIADAAPSGRAPFPVHAGRVWVSGADRVHASPAAGFRGASVALEDFDVDEQGWGA